MARDLSLPPKAACLSASLRDLGYSLETAIADLIDNSIFAEARTIHVICDLAADHPLLIVLDDGHGMSEDELLDAMCLGSSNPGNERAARDLGRFGLGLKTASFSQCRQLSVVSVQNGGFCAAEWDLDRISVEDKWLLSLLNEEEIRSLPWLENLGENGTAVIWRKLDRLFESQTGNSRDEIVNEKLMMLRKHLSLVFHRYLSGEIRGYPKISITVNGDEIKAFDPFCRDNPATQTLPEEKVRIGDAEVRLQPYILPHFSKLTASEYDFFVDRSDFISNQGAYIYRNGRLMAWGDWFRLIPRGEATKLGRVLIDFPNSLDEEWTIDIKKSRAYPPKAVRDRLRQIIDKISYQSIRVHQGRGQKLFQETKAPLWERYADRSTGVRFALNSKHPLVLALRSKLQPEDKESFDVLIESIAASLPVEMIYSDCSTNGKNVHQEPTDCKTVQERLEKLKIMLEESEQSDAEIFRQIVCSLHLFSNQMDVVESFIRENFS